MFTTLSGGPFKEPKCTLQILTCYLNTREMDECLLDASYLEHVFSLRVRGMYRDYLTLFFLKKKK